MHATDGRAPPVSIRVPARTPARFLRPALESRPARDMTDLEVVVPDDGSTDATGEIGPGRTGAGVLCGRTPIRPRA